MAEVFRVADLVRGEDVALKVLRPARGARPDHITSEFRFIAGLRHPGIVWVFDYGLTDAGEPFFTMELCEGPDLYAYSAQVGAREAILALRQAVATLGFVHARGIVHADLKPPNILMGRTAGGALAPRLLDFGIAWRAAGAHPGRSDRMGGTAHFMAPEAAEGVRSVATDLYALGVMLFQLLTGRLPFQGDTLWDVLDAHLRQPAPDPRALAPDAPPALCELTLRLLEKAPGDRPAHAAEVVAGLDAWLGGEAADFAPRAAALAAHAEPLLVGRDEALRVLTEDTLGAREASAPSNFTPACPQARQGEAEAERGAGPDAARQGEREPRQQPAGARVVVVSGHAGMGKTRLLDEARLAVQLRGAPTVALSLAHAEAPQLVLDRLEAAVAGLAPPPDAHPRRGPGARGGGLMARARALGDALGALVASRGAVFVTLDDLDQASPEAAHLLLGPSGILRRAARPGLTAVAAVHGASEVPQGGGRLPIEERLDELGVAARVNLGRLEVGGVQALVTSVLGEVDGLAAIAEQLLREAGGVPGATVATLRAWLGMGALVSHGGVWSVSPHLQGALPPPAAGTAAQWALAEPLSDLPPALLRAATAASVLGERFDAALLAAALGPEERPGERAGEGDGGHGLAALQALVRRGIVAPKTGGREGGWRAYGFVRDAARRAFRARADPQDARRWALGAAAVLARRRAAHEPVSLAQLAGLLVAAGGGVEVVEVALAAADELVAGGDTARAVEVLRDATDGVDPVGL